jgi:hypothetical protein
MDEIGLGRTWQSQLWWLFTTIGPTILVRCIPRGSKDVNAF